MVKNLPANAGDAFSISGSERSPGGGNGNPLQYPCLENAMDGGAYGLQSMGSQKVRHNLSTKQQQQNTIDWAAYKQPLMVEGTS